MSETGKHTVFGRVSAGMVTIQRMGGVPVDGSDRPLTEVRVHRAYIPGSHLITSA